MHNAQVQFTIRDKFSLLKNRQGKAESKTN